jgi:hypothetical protein
VVVGIGSVRMGVTGIKGIMRRGVKSTDTFYLLTPSGREENLAVVLIQPTGSAAKSSLLLTDQK